MLLSIIIPHKRGPHNDAALSLNIRRLVLYTVNSFELIIDTDAPKDPYKIWNEAAAKARGDILVFTNSDVIMGQGWDELFGIHMQDNAIFTGYLIEPGTIGVASQNIHKDFGRNPMDFHEHSFDDYVYQLEREKPAIIEQRGWYMPCALRRDWFLSTGGFDTTLGFPNPNDILFWERCIKEYGTKLMRVASFAYHFQNLSGRD